GTSRWNAMKEEIEFVSRGLGLPLQTVASAFHANGGKVAPTITYLLDTYDDGSTEADDSEEHYAQLADLDDEFGKAVNAKYLDKLLRFCKSDKAAVFQLADNLSQYRPPAPVTSLNG